ncbi:MAG: phage tail tape measure protein [Candidatus Kapaibacterium sp.]
MPGQLGIEFALTPVFDVQGFNTIITHIKKSLGPLGEQVNPIDEKRFNESFDKINKGAKSSSDSFKKFGDQVKQTAKTGSTFQKAFAFNQVAQSMMMFSSALSPFLNSFAELDKQVKNIGTLGRQDFEEFAKLATDLSTEVPDDAATIAQGAYQAISAGMQGSADEIMKFVEVASKAGVAGLSDTQAAVDGLSSVLNAYGMETSEVNKVADTFFAGIKLGKTTFQELNASIANSVPLASAMGVSFEENTAMIAQMTAQGTPTLQAATQINAALTLLQKGNTNLESALAGYGTSLVELREKMKLPVEQGGGLINVLNTIKKAADNSGKAVAELTGRVEAAKLIESLAGTEDKFIATFQKYSDLVVEVEGGAAAKAFDVASESISAKVAGVMSSIQAMFNRTFSMLGENAAAAVQVFNQLMPTLMGLGALQSLIPPGAISAVSNYSMILIKKLVPSLVASATAMYGTATASTISATAFRAMWAALTGPVGLVIAGIAAVTATMVLLYNNVKPVRDAMDFVWSGIVAGAEAAWSVVKAGIDVFMAWGGVIFEFVIAPFKIAWSVIEMFASAAGNLFPAAEKGAGAFDFFGEAADWVTEKLQFFTAILKGVTGVIQSFVETNIKVIKSILSFDFGGLIDAFSGAGEDAANAFNEGFSRERLQQNLDNMKEDIEEGLAGGVEVQAKLDASKSAKDMIGQLEKVQNEMPALQLKVESGTASEEEKQKLIALRSEARELSGQLKEIAPEAVSGINTWVDANGDLTQSYEINTDKARELADANVKAYSGDVDQAIKDYSKTLTDQLKTYRDQKNKLEEIGGQIQKTNDPEQVKKLTEQYNRQREVVSEYHNDLVSGYEKGAKAGLLTAGAARKIESETGIAAGTANELAEAARKHKEETAGAAENLITMSAAYSEINDSLKNILEQEKSEYLFAVRMRNLYQKQPELYQKVYSKLTQSQKDQADKAVKMSAESIAQMKTEATEALRLTKAWESASESEGKLFEKKKEKQTVVRETTKDILAEVNAMQSEHDVLEKIKETELERMAAQQGVKISSKDELALNAMKLANLEAQKGKIDEIKSAFDVITDETGKIISFSPRLDEKNRDKLQKEIYSINQAISKSEITKIKLETSIDADKAKTREEIAKIEDELKEKQKQSLKLKFEMEVLSPEDYFSETQKILQNELNGLLDTQNDLQQRLIEAHKQGDDEATKKVIANLKLQLAETKDLTLNKQKEIEDLKLQISENNWNKYISGISGVAEREKAIRLREARVAFEKELEIVRGNHDAELAAFEKLQMEKYDIQQEYLSKSSALYGAMKTLQESFANLEIRSTDQNEIDRVKSDYEEKRSYLEKDADAVYEAYRKKEITVKEYYKKLNDLESEKSKLKEEQAAKINELEVSPWDAAKNAAIEAMKQISENSFNQLDELLQKRQALNATMMERDREIEQLEYEHFRAMEEGKVELARETAAKIEKLKGEQIRSEEAVNKANEKAWTQRTIAYGSMFGTMLAEGENFGKASIKLSLKLLKQELPIYVAGAIMKSFQEGGGLLGPILAGIATAGIYAAISFAESAVQGMETGGLVRGGERMIRINEQGEEYVVNASATARNMRALEYINRHNATIEDYVRANPQLQRQLTSEFFDEELSRAKQQTRLMENALRNTRAAKDRQIDSLIRQNRELIKDNADMKDMFARAMEKMGDVAAAFESRQRVELSGEFRADGRDMKATIDRIEQKRLRYE